MAAAGHSYDPRPRGTWFRPMAKRRRKPRFSGCKAATPMGTNILGVALLPLTPALTCPTLLEARRSPTCKIDRTHAAAAFPTLPLASCVQRHDLIAANCCCFSETWPTRMPETSSSSYHEAWSTMLLAGLALARACVMHRCVQ